MLLLACCSRWTHFPPSSSIVSSRTRYTGCTCVAGVHTCARPIFHGEADLATLGLAGTVRALVDAGAEVQVRGELRELTGVLELSLDADQLTVGQPQPVCVEHSQWGAEVLRSEEHTSDLQSLMRLSYAVFCLTDKINTETTHIDLAI